MTSSLRLTNTPANLGSYDAKEGLAVTYGSLGTGIAALVNKDGIGDTSLDCSQVTSAQAQQRYWYWSKFLMGRAVLTHLWHLRYVSRTKLK